MTKPQEDIDPTPADASSKPEKRPSTGPWDPFRYLIKTISPQQRAELWRLQVPILPQEEFMTTEELRRARLARLRRPVIIAAGALLVILAVFGLWWRASASRAPLASSQSLPAVLPPVITSALHASLEPPAASASPKSARAPQVAQSAPAPSSIPVSGVEPRERAQVPTLSAKPRGAKPSESASKPPSSAALPSAAVDNSDQPFMPAAQ